MTRARPFTVFTLISLALLMPLLSACITAGFWTNTIAAKAVDPELSGTPARMATWLKLTAIRYQTAVPLDEANQPVALFRYQRSAKTLEAVVEDIPPARLQALGAAARRGGLVATAGLAEVRVDASSDESQFTFQSVLPPKRGEEREVYAFAHWRRQSGAPSIVPPGTPLPAEARIVVLPSSVPTPTERLGLIPLLAVGTLFTVPMNIILAGPTTPT